MVGTAPVLPRIAALGEKAYPGRERAVRVQASARVPSLPSVGVRIPVVDLSEAVDRVAVELDRASQVDRAGQDELDMAAGANSCARFEYLRVNQTTPSPAGIPAKRTQADITETF